MASDCDSEEHKKVIQALWREGDIKRIRVETREQLGEWAGLARINEDGDAEKIVKTTCVAVTDFGEESDSLDKLLKYLQSQEGSNE